ncbi:MAG: winged helix-turn-helix transcriptional regulator [Halobacteriaceae archaeon]
MSLSDLDRRVLAALRTDGRATLRDVADAADLPTATVAERVQELEESGVVVGYEPRLDYDSLGYDTRAVFELETNQTMLPNVVARLHDERQVTTVYEVAGKSDVVVLGRYAGSEAVEDQRRALWRIPGVVDVSVSVVERTHRDFDAAPLDPETEAAPDADPDAAPAAVGDEDG